MLTKAEIKLKSDKVMLRKEEKQSIVQEAKTYLASHAEEGASQNQLARDAGISIAYLSDIMNDRYVTGQKDTPIADKYFLRLAYYLRMEVGNQAMALHLNTDNYSTCFYAFERARSRKVVTCIDGHTGAGKSYAAQRYKQANPKNTFVATCDADMTAKDFVEEVAAAVGLKNLNGTRYHLRRQVVKRLQKVDDALLIIDESENMREANWGSIKRIIDDLTKKFAGITIIGANEFKDKMQKKAEKDKACFPQIYRRLKQGGFYKLLTLDVEQVDYVCSNYGLSTYWNTVLFDSCSNMGELTERVVDIKEEYQKDSSLTDQEIEKIVFDLWD